MILYYIKCFRQLLGYVPFIKIINKGYVLPYSSAERLSCRYFEILEF